ncbi:sensor histidine kinase [Nocardia sp. CA-084685]|uniref:sensor histidine kinase n=1 Tax=Nocardia sp. CA-084685 TaxID=3239970 RepID=UPI003D9823D4
MVPSIVLLATGGLVAISLATTAQSARAWAEYQREITDPNLNFITAVQGERTTSLLTLAGSGSAAAELAPRRARTDTAIGELNRAIAGLRDIDPDSVAQASANFADLSQQIRLVRQSVDTRSTDATQIDGFYSKLVAIVSSGLEESATRNASSHENVAQEFTMADLVQVADLHSRATGLAAFVAVHGDAESAAKRAITALDGAFAAQLTTVLPQLPQRSAETYRALSGGRPWQLAALGRHNLAEDGTLSMQYDEWSTAAQSVDAGLLELLRQFSAHTFDASDSTATKSLTRSIGGGTILAVMTLAALVVAAVLANRLIARLRNLRARSLELAEETLPALLERIHNGDEIDIDAETADFDTRRDEIGQVSAAFLTAQRAAIEAAVGEARTRAGFNRVFLDIANRNQTVVRRQLQILDTAESKQNDAEQLQYLFDLDHLTTRARRNAENLLILGGGEAARRWRQPVSLEEIVRSAVSETEHLARVGGVRVPQVWVEGKAVADLVHLLAELIDNATGFSPPDAAVSVYGNFVGRGVAIEIEDQGLGIRFEERERLNELLRNPPEFHEMALAGRRNLGLFVVGRLARRQEVGVNLQESAYGGVKAIVLIPDELLQQPPGDSLAAETPRLPSAGRRRDRTEPMPPPGRTRGTSIDSEPSASPILVTTGRAPLPTRQRQTHLKRELRDTDKVAGPSSGETQRNPDAARGAMMSFQRGTRQGRGSIPDSID